MTIPTLPKAVIPNEPPPPELNLPPVLVITAEEAAYYTEACDAFDSDNSDDDYSETELLELYPGLTQSSACDWAVYGFTVQDWLTVESQMSEVAAYVEQLRAQIDFLVGMIHERQQIMDQQLESIKSINKK